MMKKNTLNFTCLMIMATLPTIFLGCMFSSISIFTSATYETTELVRSAQNGEGAKETPPIPFLRSDTKVPYNQIKRNITQISLIGERNSGTTWTAAYLEKCFGGKLTVQDKLVRNKHWFQDDVDDSARVKGTLVIAQFRNPYHWLEAMRATPHHAPLHYKKDWETFLMTPWTMPRTSLDLAYLKTQRKKGISVDNITCQEGYAYNQINACLRYPFSDKEKDNTEFKSYFPNVRSRDLPGYSSHRPQYELRNDGSGAPYGSIIDLRSEKIKNFLEIAQWDWVDEFMPLKYEDMLTRGTGFIIEHIEDVTGIKAKCDPIPPQDRPQRKLKEQFIVWLNKYLDWETEKLIGYEQISSVQ